MKSITLRIFWIITLMIIFNHLTAQSVYQNVKGHITDKASKMPLGEVSVIILGTEPALSDTSDKTGSFFIRNVPIGRYDIKFIRFGYSELTVPNILVTAGKEVELEIDLEEQVTAMQGTVVKSSKKNETVNDMSRISARSFSMEEVNRFSGGHGDPSRLVANFAGVSAPNDSRNDIVVRGNSPTGVLWRIEGLNIPNPNHFSTMGTTGGPVSALNTNMLKNSDFITSAFAPEYGNALAGVFDIGFRNGNSNKREHTFQMGMFTGLEAMTEGPIKKGNGSSYVVAARYSFTGLAQNMGMNLGTSAIPKYQDISFKFNGGESKFGKFTLFGLGGTSNINFIHNPNDSMNIYTDPTRDAYSVSKIWMVGLSHVYKISSKTFIKTIIGSSSSQNSFKQDSISVSDNENTFRIIDMSTSQTNFTFNSSYNAKVNSKFKFKLGVIGEIMSLNLMNKDRQNSNDWLTIYDNKDNTSLYQVYVQGRYYFNQKLSLTGGIHSQHLTLNNKTSIEPRMAFNYQLNRRNSFSLGYGWHEQMQALTTYFYKSQNSDGSYSETNKNLNFSRSQHFVLGYDLQPAKNWRVKAETYYQYLSNIPVSNELGSFSSINQGASFAPDHVANLINKGTGINYGAELTVEKFFSKGSYGLITASVYDSKYKGSDEILRNTAFNGKYTVNILAGKEYKFGQDGKHVFTIDTKLTGAGGKYYTPTDLQASQAVHKQVLMGDQYAYSLRYSDYIRWDLKLGVRLNNQKHKMVQSFFIDFQNVTNHKNVYGIGYNKKTNQINTAYQSGFLPNFIYRINF